MWMRLKAVFVNFKVTAWLTTFSVVFIKVIRKRRMGISPTFPSVWAKSKPTYGSRGPTSEKLSLERKLLAAD